MVPLHHPPPCPNGARKPSRHVRFLSTIPLPARTVRENHCLEYSSPPASSSLPKWCAKTVALNTVRLHHPPRCPNGARKPLPHKWFPSTILLATRTVRENHRVTYGSPPLSSSLPERCTKTIASRTVPLHHPPRCPNGVRKLLPRIRFPSTILAAHMVCENRCLEYGSSPPSSSLPEPCANTIVSCTVPLHRRPPCPISPCMVPSCHIHHAVFILPHFLS